MRRTLGKRNWIWAVAAVVTGGSLIAPVRAQDPDDQRRGVARVSIAQGEVSVRRGDSGEWVAATVNAPLMTGDRISTGVNSRAEVQFDGANYLRMGGDAEVEMTQLEAGRYQMGLARGTVTFRILRSSNTDIELDTPSISVRPSKIGAYRVAVTDAGETEVTARSGEVEVFSPGGTQWVRSGQTLMARGAAADPEFQIVRASPADEWDRWNEGRDQVLARSNSSQYVGPGVYGVEDLDSYGSWVSVPEYGYVWRPLVVEGWAPYRQGRWVWTDWYGWTWVSYEPWGWAPYHYGRWFYQPAYGWCWYPGVVHVRHYWSPALVAFFGFGGGGVNVAFGNVGWVPLAPYEALHPWWGRGYYGSATYINRSINITNVNITNVYRNARVQNGYSVVSGTDFHAGRFNNFVNVSNEQLRGAAVVRGPLPLAPDRTHLQFSERQAPFVPRGTPNARFFTREQPNPAPRVSFDEQRRAFGQPSRAAEPSVATRGSFGAPAAQMPGARNDGGGWQRFGNPREAQSSQTQSVTLPNNRGWNRFGDSGVPQRMESAEPTPRGEVRGQPSFGGNRQEARPEFRSAPSFTGSPEPRAIPEPRTMPQNRPESLRLSPPVYRDRPSGGNAPAFAAPPEPRGRPSGGNAPAFSAPPRSESRMPSGGGGGGAANRGGGSSRGGGNSGTRGGGRTR